MPENNPAAEGLGRSRRRRLRRLTASGRLRAWVVPDVDVRLDGSQNDRVGVLFPRISASLYPPGVEPNLPDVFGVVGEGVREIHVRARDCSEDAQERAVFIARVIWDVLVL